MLQQGQLTPGLTQHCSVQPTPCSPFPLSEGMGASSYPHAFVKHSAPYTRAEHHRSQLQPIPALLLGHRGSKSGHKEAWGSPSTCPTLTPIPHSHPSHSLPSHAHTQGQQAVAPPAPGLHRAAGSGPRSPIGQEGTGSPPSPTAQQGSPHRHAALQEVQSGDAAAVLDAVALQPLQHGHERGRGGLHDVPQLLHAQVFPCGHNGVNARRGARRGGGGGGGEAAGAQSLPYCGERGSDTARTRRVRRAVPRCRSARVSCTSCSGLTRPARTHPGGGLRAGRERGQRRGGHRAGPQLSGRHLPERLVPLQRPTRGATAPGGRTQRQHGGERPAPAAGRAQRGGSGTDAPIPPPPIPAPRPVTPAPSRHGARSREGAHESRSREEATVT